MKIAEILTESQQLDEGPIGSVAGAVGRGLAKGMGGLAKGAGMIAGIGKGLKTAYQKGKATSAAHIAGDVPEKQKQADPEAQAAYDKEYQKLTQPQQGGGAAAGSAPAPAPAPAAAAPAPAAAAPTAQQINKAGPAGTAPAKAQSGAAGQALAKTSAAMDQQGAEKAGQTMYAQVKANVDKLDKKGKQRILQLLQKSLAQAPAKPTAAPTAGQGSPVAKPATAPAKPAAAPAAGGGTAPVKKKPVQVKAAGAKAAPAAPAVQNAGLEKTGKVVSESFSIYRKQ